MPVDQIVVREGVQSSEDIGRFGVIHVDARDGHPLTVRLGVVTDQENRYTLGVGDTFPVRDETWFLDRVERSGAHWRVVVSRVVDPRSQATRPSAT